MIEGVYTKLVKTRIRDAAKKGAVAAVTQVKDNASVPKIFFCISSIDTMYCKANVMTSADILENRIGFKKLMPQSDPNVNTLTTVYNYGHHLLYCNNLAAMAFEVRQTIDSFVFHRERIISQYWRKC